MSDIVESVLESYYAEISKRGALAPWEGNSEGFRQIARASMQIALAEFIAERDFYKGSTQRLWQIVDAYRAGMKAHAKELLDWLCKWTTENSKRGLLQKEEPRTKG